MVDSQQELACPQRPVALTTMETSKELEEALSRRFFPHMEAMGFVRDERQGPRITCFRRKAAWAMQIFAILRDPKGHARFSVLFTEAPLAGIDYAGKWLAAEDVFPGNFALPQGWLSPKPGNTWFGVRRTWWSRLVSRKQEMSVGEQAVGEIIRLFPEILEWWETKVKGPHLLLLPSRPPPAVPTHAPVSGIPVKPSLLQRFFRQRNRLAGWLFWDGGVFHFSACDSGFARLDSNACSGCSWCHGWRNDLLDRSQSLVACPRLDQWRTFSEGRRGAGHPRGLRWQDRCGI